MIQAKYISKVYKKKGQFIVALKKCNLTLPDNGLVVIVGQTGSGKSTLLSILGGMQKPNSGVVIGAQDAVSFVFQNSMLLDDMTLDGNISFVKRLYPVGNDDISALIERFGLSDRLNNYPNELSGGEKQRAALLIAMLQNKAAIFADEPTGNLDDEHARGIAQLLKQLSLSRLVVVVTHDDDIFSEYADRIIVMSGGSIVSDNCLAEDKTECAGAKKKFTARVPRFGIKQAADVAVSVVKRSKTRFVCLVISLLLAFLCVLTFTNNLFSREENRVYTALSSQNAVCMDFVKTDEENFQPLKMTEEQLDNYLTKFDAAYFIEEQTMPIFSMNGNALTNGTRISRTYVSDECKLQILAGKVALADGEIAISDYVASEICTDYFRFFGEQLGYDDLIGARLDDNTISAVYSTGYDGRQPDDGREESFNAQYRTAYVNEHTYTSAIPTSTQVNYAYGDMYANFVVMYCGEQPFGYELLCGSDDNLGEGEVLLSDRFVASLNGFDGDIQDLIGTKVTLTFAEMSCMPANAQNLISVADGQYTVAGVYSSQLTYNCFIMNANDYPELYFKYSTQITGSSAGISVAGCDLSIIKSAYADGLSDGSFARYDISDSYSWLQTIAIIAVFVSAVLIAISFVILLSFINDSVAKNVRTMGVLRALGVSSAKIACIWLLQCAVCLAVVFIAAAALQVPLVFAWNGLVRNVIEYGVSIVYYGWQSVLLTVGVLGAYLACAYVAIILRIMHKSSSDLVYER